MTLWINFYFFQIVLETFSFIFSQIHFLFSFKYLKQLFQSFLLDFLNSNWFLNFCRILLNFFFIIFQYFNHFFLYIFINLRCFKLTLNLIFKKPLGTKQIMWSKMFNRTILNSTFRAFVFWINFFADNTFRCFIFVQFSKIFKLLLLIFDTWLFCISHIILWQLGYQSFLIFIV